MMKKIYIVISMALLGCSQEKLSDQSVVEANTVQRNYTELDTWIRNELTLPYGIEVDYRWNGNTAQKGSYTYPPEAENVQKMLEAIKFLWLETYTLNNVGGSHFMKEKNPIKIYMYGGKNLDAHGVELLANHTGTTAEMFLYNVNDFDPKDYEKVYVLMRSVHHQFAKRLMELYPYDRDKFLTISNKYVATTKDLPSREKLDTFIRKISDCQGDKDRTDFTYVISSQESYQAARLGFFSLGKFIEADAKLYTENCELVPRRETIATEGVIANRRGFFTIHSMISPEDDFAEVISAYLTHSSKEISDAITIGGTPLIPNDVEDERNAVIAREHLLQKQAFVEDYFKKEIKINLKRMQILSVQRIKSFVNR
ncbi:putative zinc-binding metallopeptidase [Capnocytophaga stomatis]|uniref:putative zinc-binding metallopeptidase n=1 Tax=Capnocytophaga stomatis TaxID=1848904 RepID=UPI00385F3B47